MEFYRINLADASMTCLLCDHIIKDADAIKGKYCPQCKVQFYDEAITYSKTRQERFDLMQSIGNHVRNCETCGKDPNDCTELEKFYEKAELLSKDLNPKWYRWVLNRIPSDTKDFGWIPVRLSMDGGAFLKAPNWSVLVSGDFEDDGKRWIHYSTSRNGGRTLVSWEDLREVKAVFVGQENLAVQVFPSEYKYVNVRSGITEVLHLWRPVDGLNLPDFTRGGTVI